MLRCILTRRILTNGLLLGLADGVLGETRAVKAATGGTLATAATPDIRLALHLLRGGDNARAGTLLESKILALKMSVRLLRLETRMLGTYLGSGGHGVSASGKDNSEERSELHFDDLARQASILTY